LQTHLGLHELPSPPPTTYTCDLFPTDALLSVFYETPGGVAPDSSPT
jgi:hypothetical protein